jgi:hypothetical protein
LKKQNVDENSYGTTESESREDKEQTPAALSKFFQLSQKHTQTLSTTKKKQQSNAK